MAKFDMRTQSCVDYHLIVEPCPAGSTIGYLAKTPIAEVVTDLFGRRFTYAGAAPRKRNGAYDVDSLRPGEFIVEPGLMYRLDPGKRATRDAAENNRSSLARSPQLPTQGAESANKTMRVLSEIARTLLFCLIGVLAIQLVLHAFHVG
jgi:hypothetical protein